MGLVYDAIFYHCTHFTGNLALLEGGCTVDNRRLEKHKQYYKKERAFPESLDAR
jgi:hypothetical protein